MAAVEDGWMGDGFLQLFQFGVELLAKEKHNN